MGPQEWKLLHVLAVVLFLGNLGTCLFWAARAAGTRSPSIIAHTFAGIRRADRWFTLPGAVGIVIGGVAAAIRLELPVFGTGWVLWASGLLAIGLLILVTVRPPLQRDIEDFAASSVGENDDEIAWSEFELMYRYWRTWTTVAIALPLGAVLLMVYRPPLPGF